jgi:hypothetical protein
MQPILNGAPGFILLAISFAIGAYIRQVYVAASDIYDKIIGKELKLWPRELDFTISREHNLQFVLWALKSITHAMFFFIMMVSARLLATAAKPVIGVNWPTDDCLHRVDLFLVAYLTAAFALMWLTHTVGSWKERNYHKAMYEHWKTHDPNAPQSNAASE